MLELSPKQAMLVFGELVQCYYGSHGYGGDTAEIYAYRLGRMTATAYEAIKQENPEGIYGDALTEFSRESSDNLYAICRLFQDAYDCSIMVGGKPINEGIIPFSHRAHVTVKRNK